MSAAQPSTAAPGWRQLLSFYFPLVLTSQMMTLSNPLINLALLDSGEYQSDSTQALLVTGAHGLFHVFLDVFLERHAVLGGKLFYRECPGAIRAGSIVGIVVTFIIMVLVFVRPSGPLA